MKRKKIELCTSPRLQKLKMQWQKRPLRANVEKILNYHGVWYARLLNKRKLSVLNGTYGFGVASSIRFRRAIASLELKKMVRVFQRPKKSFAKKLYLYLRQEDLDKRIFTKSCEYFPTLAERIWDPLRRIFILPEARIVVIDFLDNPDHNAISKILNECAKNSSLPEESKRLLEHWEESYSILSIGREAVYETQDYGRVISEKCQGLLDECSILENLSLMDHPHSLEFYNTASRCVFRSRICPESPSSVASLLSFDLADEMYSCLMKNIRDPICRHQGRRAKESHPIAGTFPIEWVETEQKRRFDSDSTAGRLKIYASCEFLEELMEDFFSLCDDETEEKAQKNLLFPILREEILHYFSNIFDAFFRPERKLIQLYERQTGHNVFQRIAEASLFEMFFMLDLEEDSFYFSNLEEIKDILGSENISKQFK